MSTTISYKIMFVPENNYGCITKRTINKKEAYSIYRKLKQELGELRPGELCIFEVKEDGSEQYLCRLKTGKNRNGKLLVQDLKKQIKHLKYVYNVNYLDDKYTNVSNAQLDIIHGLEIVDRTKVNEERLMEYVTNKQEVLAHARRQYKQDLKLAKQLQTEIEALTTHANMIANIMSKQRQEETKCKNSMNKNMMIYLESLGIDVDEYINNANPETTIPFEIIIEPIDVKKACENK